VTPLGVEQISVGEELPRLMGKSEANSDHVVGRMENTGASEVTATRFDSTEIDNTDSSRNPSLDDLLPFLEERIVFKMPSEIRHMDGVLYYLNERMLKLGIVHSEDSEVLIALDEAIVNAIKHGNKCDPRKAVHIVAEFTSDGARFTISDEGSGFVRENVPDPTDPCRLLEPNGRGLLLINHIMDEVCFNQSGNQLEMFKRATDKTE
jgi:serine/threonine-protein kinase RsbW